MAKFPERVFSGVQPTGNLHLGNYLGAIKRFVEMQKTHPCIYCVVDLHAMTLAARARAAAAHHPRGDRGLSRLRHRSEGAISSSTRAAWPSMPSSPGCSIASPGSAGSNRMTQFKEKAGKDRENASIGLFNYPVLMAADILLYRATHVPVGDDQKQHLDSRGTSRRSSTTTSPPRSPRMAMATLSSRCPSR